MPDNNLPETTALHDAARRSDSYLRKLLEQGGDPSNIARDGSLPIHVAAMCGKNSNIELLLEYRNFDINTKIKSGKYARYTPLHIALACRNFKCAELILKEKDIIIDEFVCTHHFYKILKLKEKWPNSKVSNYTKYYSEYLIDIFLDLKPFDYINILLRSHQSYSKLAELVEGFVSHLENDDIKGEDAKSHLEFLQSLTKLVFYLDYSSEYKQQISDINYHLGMYLYHNADISEEPNSMPMLLLLLSYSERPIKEKSDILMFLKHYVAGIQISGGKQSKEDKALCEKRTQQRQKNTAELIDTLIEQVLVGESPALIALGLITDALGGKDSEQYKGYYEIFRIIIQDDSEISDDFIAQLKTKLDNENNPTAIDKLSVLNKSLIAFAIENYTLKGDELLELLEAKLAIRGPKGKRVFDPNVKNNNGITPLMTAAHTPFNALKRVNLLLDAGADHTLNGEGERNRTPLLEALFMDNIDVAQRLFKLDGIDVKRALPFLIRNADTNEHVSLAKEVLAHPNLDLTIKSTENGLTLLELARKYERTEIVDLFYQEPLKTKYQRALIKNEEFDVIAQELKEYYLENNKSRFKNELDTYRWMMRSNEFESLAISLLKNIGAHALDPSKHAWYEKKYDLIYHLLDITPNYINIPLADGLTLLHHAVNFERMETIHSLLNKKEIDPNVVADDATPLHLAITNKFDNPAIQRYIVKNLLAHGADASIPHADGTLPFIKAASNNLSAAASMLLKSNPKVALNALISLPSPQLVDLMVNVLGDIRSQLKNSNELDLIQQLDNVIADLLLKPETSEALNSIIYNAIKNNDIDKLRKIAKVGNVDFYCKLTDESEEGLRDFGRSAAYHAHLKGNTSLEYFLLEQMKDPAKKQQMIDDIMDADTFKSYKMIRESQIRNISIELGKLRFKCHRLKQANLKSFQTELTNVYNNFNNHKKEFTPKNVKQLTTEVQAVIEKYEESLMEHHGHKYVIANIFLSLTVIGLVAIAIKAIHSKVKTGHATVFFKRSRTAEKFTELKNALDDLPSPYANPNLPAITV